MRVQTKEKGNALSKKRRVNMKEVGMRNDFLWYGEYGKNYKVHAEDLKIQAIDTRQVLMIEQKRRNGHEKI